MAANPVRLFVYGTLKRGFCRHFALNRARFLGQGRTEPAYRLLNCGDYPALIHDPSGISVHGEVYEIDSEQLVVLDQLEGVAEGLYRRHHVLMLVPFAEARVLTYVYNQPSSQLPDCGDRWP